MGGDSRIWESRNDHCQLLRRRMCLCGLYVCLCSNNEELSNLLPKKIYR